MLQGYKTYIVAALMGLATFANSMGYITDELFKTIMGFLAASGTATVAAKMNRVEEKTEIEEKNRIE